MKKNESGCNGFYLAKDGEHCEAHQEKKITVKDCKKCNCPGNKYAK